MCDTPAPAKVILTLILHDLIHHVYDATDGVTVMSCSGHTYLVFSTQKVCFVNFFFPIQGSFHYNCDYLKTPRYTYVDAIDPKESELIRS